VARHATVVDPFLEVAMMRFSYLRQLLPFAAPSGVLQTAVLIPFLQGAISGQSPGRNAYQSFVINNLQPRKSAVRFLKIKQFGRVVGCGRPCPTVST
jgi:hypothetical protein